MNRMIVPSNGLPTPQSLLDDVADGLDDLAPELRKAAAHVLENPHDVGVSSIRELAKSARVKPNTLVRMARAFGFDGFDDFREPFRQEIRQGGSAFPDRARWLQSISREGRLAGLFADMAESAIRNIEDTFGGIDPDALKQAADVIVAARRTYVLGVGVNHSLAANFAYLAGMAINGIEALPRAGGQPVDDLARAEAGDVLLAMTFKPYRSEVVEAVQVAREQGVTILGLSDSPASPIVISADFGFVIQSDTPQFFPSTVAVMAILETLTAFVVAEAKADVIKGIERLHQRRKRLGIYQED